MAFAFSTTAFADVGGYVTANDFIRDTSHGRHYSLNSHNSVRMNQYTDGYPVSGTVVTTWNATKSNTQIWECFSARAGAGRRLIAPIMNTNISINCYRSGNAIVNMYSSIGNYYDDTFITYHSQGLITDIQGRQNPKYSLSVPNRAGHGQRFICTTNESVGGGGVRLRWYTGSGTHFIEYGNPGLWSY